MTSSLSGYTEKYEEIVKDGTSSSWLGTLSSMVGTMFVQVGFRTFETMWEEGSLECRWIDYGQIPSRNIYSGRFCLEKKLKTGKNLEGRCGEKEREEKKGRIEEKGEKMKGKGKKIRE